jgi:hypothetical protein
VRKFKTFINLEQPLLKEANKLANLQEALKLITSVVNACINPVNTGVNHLNTEPKTIVHEVVRSPVFKLN